MDKTRRCWQCKSVVELKSMRYDSTGKDLICESCLAKEKGIDVKESDKVTTPVNEQITPMAVPSASNSNSSISRSEVHHEEESKLVSYQCGSCNLGFSVSKGAMVQSCPYCGKGNFRIALRDSAQKIIEEASKEKFDD